MISQAQGVVPIGTGRSTLQSNCNPEVDEGLNQRRGTVQLKKDVLQELPSH